MILFTTMAGRVNNVSDTARSIGHNIVVCRALRIATTGATRRGCCTVGDTGKTHIIQSKHCIGMLCCKDNQWRINLGEIQRG